jgi:flagellar biosynthesis/type III secretory pathway chaperone
LLNDNSAVQLITDLVEDLKLLKQILEQEFDALRIQNLDQFETLHDRKDTLIHRISQIDINSIITFFEQEGVNGELKIKWEQVELLKSECSKIQKQNEILINKKLTVISSALEAIKNPDKQKIPEFYNPKGKLTVNP